MTRRLHSLLAFTALILHVAAMVCFAHYIAKMDWLFGHHRGPAEFLQAALRTAGGAVFATVAWLSLSIYGQLASSRSTPPRTDLPRVRVLPAVTLLTLLIPAGSIIWIGVHELPAARSESRFRYMLSGSPTAAEIVAALKSDDDNLRWSAAAAIVRLASVERATERHGLLADKEQVTKLVVALVAALNDSNPRQAGGQLVAYNAAQALGAIGPDAKQAIPALAAPRNRALEIDDEALRASATVALDSIDPNWRQMTESN